jgi:peptide/nickel transport system substrate-binding protein
MRLARTRRSGRRRGLLGAGIAVAGLAVVLAACGPVSSGSTTVGTTPTSGGIATYATLPGFPATYIFPFQSSTFFTATNSNDLQYQLYRPLYWFGTGTKPTLNKPLSLAYPPSYNKQVVTIKLKGIYKWSNGQPVTAQDILFWIHMTQAMDTPKELNAGNGWAGYIPGYFPDNVTNIHAISTTELQMTIKGPYSETWFTDNELSQITPMPKAWDETAKGASDCEGKISDCVAVFTFLNKTAATPSAWSAAPWNVVDGPWQVTSAHEVGGTGGAEVTMSYNHSYDGPVGKHHIDKFELVPFVSEQSEFNQLEDPGNNPIDFGYLPTVDAPVPPAGNQVGSNPVSLSGYKLTVVYPWALSYFPYNFNDATAGPIFKQLYFRQAFQSLVDQEGVVNGPMHGYGKVTVGPVDDYPVTADLSPFLAAHGDQWTLSPSHAESLLKNHGWTINTNGSPDTCARPGSGKNDCGPGIKAGDKLDFSMIYATGVDWMDSQVKELVSNASLVGIKISPQAESATDVVDTAFSPTGSWQLAEWGQWTYAPDYLPTGEELFQTTSVANGGHYSNSHNDALITASLQAQKPSAFDKAMYTWEDYLADQLPVVWTPNVATLDESVNDLYIGPQSPTLTLTPEFWYYLK